MFDEETLEMLEGKNSAAVERLVEGMKLRHEAARMKEAAKELDERGQELLSLAYWKINDKELKTLVAAGIGKVTFVLDAETGKRVNRAKMEKVLLEKGVAPTLIAEAKAEATSPSKKQDLQVRFQLPKGE